MHSHSARRFLRASAAASLLLILFTLLFILNQPARGATDAVSLQPVASGFSEPLLVTNARDGTGRLFVVEKAGKIWIVQNGQRLPTPFLDITDRVMSVSEAGLLGLAFPPDYAQKGYFFVYYTHADQNLALPEPIDNGNNSGYDTVVARFRLSANPNVADAGSEERILIRNQPYVVHNGGNIAFGPDGYLYIGLGDGGDANDLLRQGQNLGTVLGKMLRIAVGATGTYTIPPGNPYANTPGAKPEIWDVGLRNPWRWSFDRGTGDLMIGDVGQEDWEELDIHPAGVPGGLNFGWSCYEALAIKNWNTGGQTCDGVAFVSPHLYYPHTEGFAITGGYVYRGAAYPSLTGRYFFGDYGLGKIWSISRSGSSWTTDKQPVIDTPYAIASFGEDEAGELYIADTNGGGIYRLVSDEPPPSTATATATATPQNTPQPGTPTWTPTATPTNTPPTPTLAPPTATPTIAVDADFVLPGTQPGHLVDQIVDPDTCSACHTDPIYKAWRGSMMSQAGRDPLFWSALHVAEQDVPGSGDYCLRCHSPKGWFEGRSHPTDGSALQGADLSSGIACEVCHRAVSPAPSAAGADPAAVQRDAVIRDILVQEGKLPPTGHVGSAMLILDPEDNRRGPFSFAAPPPHPKATWRTTLLGQGVDPVAESRLCGTCHNLENPALSCDAARKQYWPNAEDTPPPSVAADSNFPVERTYEEWLNSDYATAEGVIAPAFAGAKADGIVRTCQDCHMPRTTGVAASTGNPVMRDCKTTGCLPAHVLVGGNSWVPQLLQDPRWRLAAQQDAAALDATVLAARDMLKKSATLSLSVAQKNGSKLAVVRITNESGHKLPTGYAEGRRMWIALEAYDKNDNLVYASGVYDPGTGVLADDPDLKVYEVKQGLTPELAAAVGKDAGESFHFVLNNTTVKDNRIPPRGYTVAAYARPGMVPVGATYADGQYWDETAYTLPDSAVRVVASFYYQTASKEYVDFLRANGGADGAALGMLWDDLKSPPELVAQDIVIAGQGSQPPAVVDDTFTIEPNRAALLDVLANDSDPGQGTLQLVAVAPPAQGRATVVANQIAYTPTRGFSGDIVLVYTVRNNAGLERQGQAAVRVKGVNYFPAIGKP
ncbi:MAG: PQQ-dependent sugar dehydrogenase [Caldilineaceae bacterium]